MFPASCLQTKAKLSLKTVLKLFVLAYHSVVIDMEAQLLHVLHMLTREALPVPGSRLTHTPVHSPHSNWVCVVVWRRRDVGMEVKLLQMLQQAQKSSVDQRMALLESSLIQSMDSSMASQSGLAHRLSSGFQDMRQSITQDTATQVIAIRKFGARNQHCCRRVCTEIVCTAAQFRPTGGTTRLWIKL